MTMTRSRRAVGRMGKAEREDRELQHWLDRQEALRRQRRRDAAPAVAQQVLADAIVVHRDAVRALSTSRLKIAVHPLQARRDAETAAAWDRLRQTIRSNTPPAVR